MQTATKFSWKQAPDLMARLGDIQNYFPNVDIMTFAAFCRDRAELERHVKFYETSAAALA